ncbi:hypothetical protein Tco_0767795 [Tanacetum coccineum]
MIPASTSFSTSSWIALFLSGACPLFFCLTGRHPSRIFKQCSAMLRGMPVISAGFQEKTSKFCPSRVHSSLRPFSVRVRISLHTPLRCVTVPPSTGNFSIPCVVDGMARIFLIPGLPIIPLCWDGDLTTMKFIHAEVECPSSPIFTSKDIWPSGQMVSPLNPVRYVVGGIIWLLISGRSLTKQCSYKISVDAPPSTYIRYTKCPPISASMIIGPSVPSSSPRVGKDIVVSGEKLWVTFCLATFSYGWIIRIASGLSFPVVSPLLGCLWLVVLF